MFASELEFMSNARGDEMELLSDLDEIKTLHNKRRVDSKLLYEYESCEKGLLDITEWLIKNTAAVKQNNKWLDIYLLQKKDIEVKLAQFKQRIRELRHNTLEEIN